MQTLIFVATDRIGAAATSPCAPALGKAPGTSRTVLRTRQSIAARTMAGRLLELATGLSDRQWHYSADANGRPRMRLADGREGPDISIAHSADLICCAIALDGPVGVDVEQAHPDHHYIEMAESFFSLPERHLVRRDGVPAFLACWVLREAYAKATGAGLSAVFGVDGGWTTAVRHRAAIVTIGGQKWIAGHRECGDQHLALIWQPSSIGDAMRHQAQSALDTAAAQLADSRAEDNSGRSGA